MNNAKRLPDAYDKSVGSNLYNLLQLLHLLDVDIRSDLSSILEDRNIENATGATLDAYGEMVGVKRNCSADENYRTRIIARISTLIVDSDINSVLSAIARTFDVDVSDIVISESGTNVTIQGLTMGLLNSSSCQCSEITEMIKGFIPAGVSLGPVTYKGSLEISEGRHWWSGDAETINNYPVLYYAWCYNRAKRDFGLKGHGEVPDTFADITGEETTGYFNGGTLSVRST